MRIVAFLLALLSLQTANPPACQWTHGVAIGKVDVPIDEDSGLAISRKFPDRLYHVNDSGDIGRFFVTDFAGRNTRVVHVKGFQPKDPEDLGFGACGPGVDCLFIGDIGDNSRKRGSIDLAIIEERETFPPLVEPKYKVKVRYPDGAHDAEAFAVHPDGSVFILTKGGIPQLYRLRQDQWMNDGGKAQVLERVAALDLEKLGGPAAAMDGRLPTSMDISPDGKRVLVLTYRNVFELFFDLSQPLPPLASWKAGLNFRRIDVEVLPQQEAIAYTPDGRSFIYDTEKPDRGPAQIMRSDCR